MRNTWIISTMALALFVASGATAPPAQADGEHSEVDQTSAGAAGPTIVLTPSAGSCATPPHIEGVGFPPDAPLEVVIRPPTTLPGSGGAGLALDAGRAEPDGSFHSDVLRDPGPDGTQPPFVQACERWGRVLVSVGGGRDASGARPDFPLATAEFLGVALEPPTAGSGDAPHARRAWLATAGALLIAAAGGMALIALNRRGMPATTGDRRS